MIKQGMRHLLICGMLVGLLTGAAFAQESTVTPPPPSATPLPPTPTATQPPPTATPANLPTVEQVSVSDVITANVSQIVFAVRYRSEAGFDEDTFAAEDVTISGPADTVLVTDVLVNADDSGEVMVVYQAEKSDGPFTLDDNGTYTIAILPDAITDADGLALPAQAEAATFTVRVPLPLVLLKEPAISVNAAADITLSWDHTEGVDAYVVDVYDPYRKILSEEVDAASCDDGLCTLDVTIDGVIGQYNVWMRSRIGDRSGFWSQSRFEVVLGSTALSAPAGEIPASEMITLEFPEIVGAKYYLVDVYGPRVYRRYLEENDICTDGLCRLSVPRNGERGEFVVYILPGIGPFTGEWSENRFIVGP